MMVREAAVQDAGTVAELALLLWPDHTRSELLEEITRDLSNGEMRFFLAEAQGQAIGFSHCSLRRDYVEGTHSSPVGFLEGIYVRQAFRREGVAAALVDACQAWARSLGCREFASDCELDNTASIAFHLGLGFTEANRTVWFVKLL